MFTEQVSAVGFETEFLARVSRMVRRVGSALIVAAAIVSAGGRGFAEEPVRARHVSAESTVLAPTDRGRQIWSGFLDLGFSPALSERWGVSAGGGLTLTFASGHIFQLEDDFERVRRDGSAFGAGPVGWLRLAPWIRGAVSLGIEGSGAFVVYSRPFPPGGRLYNFAWRAGPLVGFRLSEAVQLHAGWRWAHVSNGQGVTPRNPSYEGMGPSISVTVRSR